MRGKNPLEKLNQAIDSNSPGKKTVSFSEADYGQTAWANVDDGYTLKQADVAVERSGLWSTFSDPKVNLDQADEFQRVNLMSRSNPPGSPDLNEGFYNTEKGVIIIDKVDSSKDKLPKGDNRIVPASKQMAQIYQKLGGNLKDLRVIIQKDIQNKG